MGNLLDDSKERSQASSISQKKARQRRSPNPRNKGRPVKPSGIYFTEHVLIDRETYEYFSKHKMAPREPIGSVIRRIALQKKGEAPQRTFEQVIVKPQIEISPEWDKRFHDNWQKALEERSKE